MKHILMTLLILSTTLLLVNGCSQTSSTSPTSAAKTSTAPANAHPDSVLSVDQLLWQADSLSGQTVTLQGLCTHTCQHGATKIFLMGSSDAQTLRVEAGPLGSFDPKCLHRRVQVTGTLHEERIDEGYLLRWEEKLKAEADRQHTESGGCTTEKKARGETAQTAEQRIADFRHRIAQRQSTEGKAYLSFYYLEASAYVLP